MAPWPPTAQAPWSPTAQAFAQHQFSHVTNFWKQGRPASFRLEALPDGNAELSLTFKLPTASEVIPPPFFSSPAPLLKRPIIPLFPEGYAPRYVKPKQAPKLSSRRRKNYRRSVLHKAALAVHTLPPPVVGSLRQAAQACVQRQQAASALPSVKKRPLPISPSALSPSNLPPLAQRIRTDIQIGENEVESPERESLRSRLDPDSFPPLNSPHSVQKVPPPAPLVFTPPKSLEGSEMPAKVAEEVSVEKVAAFEGSEEVSAFEDPVVNDEFVGKSELSKLEEVAETSNVDESEGSENEGSYSEGSESEGSESEGDERRKTERVKVLSDYEAVFGYELTIKKGDLIDLVNDDDKRWWKGKVGGKEGYFPAACVEKV